MTVLGHSKAQPGANTTDTQGANIKWYTIQLTTMHYMTIIDTSSGYHNLKHDKIFLISNHIFMSIQQVDVHQTTHWSSTSR